VNKTNKQQRSALRIISEGATIVISILLAFGIDAWWSTKQVNDSQGRLLTGLLQESRVNERKLDNMISFRRASLETTTTLQQAAAERNSTITSDSLDHLLVNVTGNYFPMYEHGALDEFYLGGGASLLQNESLRGIIGAYRRSLEVAEVFDVTDLQFQNVTWTPFLRLNANLPQITNAQTDIPGVNMERYAADVPVLQKLDHTVLLSSQEFVNLLLEMKWVHEDALNYYPTFQQNSTKLISALEAELGIKQEEN